MKKSVSIIISLSCLLCIKTIGQEVKFGEFMLKPVNASLSIAMIKEKQAITVKQNSTAEATNLHAYAKINDINFHNGTIELKVLSTLTNNAPNYSRGFIGIAFHINDDDSKFECIYLRPTNARSDDQLKRNHSIQYSSIPDFGWSKLRKEDPGKYESYADMALNEWIDMKIIVNGTNAKLFLNNNEQPSLIVNDLKLGEDAIGTIGLFVDIGTEGYFSDIKITEK